MKLWHSNAIPNQKCTTHLALSITSTYCRKHHRKSN